jgi:hypothetical protein
MEPIVPLSDYIDAREAAVESRLEQKLNGLATKSTVWAAVATIIGVLLAVLSFGGDRFDAGLSSSQIISDYQAKQANTDRVQNAKLLAIDGKLDQIIAQTAAESRDVSGVVEQ